MPLVTGKIGACSAPRSAAPEQQCAEQRRAGQHERRERHDQGGGAGPESEDCEHQARAEALAEERHRGTA